MHKGERLAAAGVALAVAFGVVVPLLVFLAHSFRVGAR